MIVIYRFVGNAKNATVFAKLGMLLSTASEALLISSSFFLTPPINSVFKNGPGRACIVKRLRSSHRWLLKKRKGTLVAFSYYAILFREKLRVQ